jgi:hypothetical protein
VLPGGPLSLQQDGCEARRALALEFKQCLSEYGQKMTELLDRVGAEAASQECRQLFEACVLKRMALQRHDQEHHCSGNCLTNGHSA